MSSSVIQEQYREYPYPVRDPESERGRLIFLIGSSLAEINHWLFQGKESFQKGFRVLVAGGGTGDASTFLALQLQNTDAEIVYLDFSPTSLEIAKKRAEIRGLKNIRWVCDSILRLPELNLGKFDYIDCTGVLHHLESPLLGLKLLRESLTEKGGMNLMLYGKYGRGAVYLLQDLLKRVCQGAKSRKEEILMARKVIASLPKDHPFWALSPALLEELKTDEGLYDLCLHKKDRAFTISEIEELAQLCDLHFVDFFEPAQRLAFLPEIYTQDEELLSCLKPLKRSEQRAAIELLAGNMYRHAFCVSRVQNSVASLDDLDLVPFLSTSSNLLLELRQACKDFENLQNYENLSLNFGAYSVKIPVTAYTKPLFDQIDEQKSLREIFAAINQASSICIPDSTIIEETKRLLMPLIEAGIVLLRDQKIAPFPKWME